MVGDQKDTWAKTKAGKEREKSENQPDERPMNRRKRNGKRRRRDEQKRRRRKKNSPKKQDSERGGTIGRATGTKHARRRGAAAAQASSKRIVGWGTMAKWMENTQSKRWKKEIMQVKKIN